MQYRAVENTNTITRRLAYLTTVLWLLRRQGVATPQLLERLQLWSEKNQQWLRDYWVSTGEIRSTAGNTTARRYLDLSVSLGLAVPIAGQVRISRHGLVLYSLGRRGTGPNPFHLSLAERAFYLHLLLSRDADVLLAVADLLLEMREASLGEIQGRFQEALLRRLSQKADFVQQEYLKKTLLDRHHKIRDWRRPKRYVEHLVPPRLNWLLDLGFLREGEFAMHKPVFNMAGRHLLEEMPRFGVDGFRDVTANWLDDSMWQHVPIMDKSQQPQAWSSLGTDEQNALMAEALVTAFRLFRRTTVPRVSLTPTILYLSIFLLTERETMATPLELTKWLSSPRSLEGRRYEVRLSARENESYLIITSA